MEAVIFVGLQGSGKSTFFDQRFAGTHARISLDQLKTRRQERSALDAAVQAGRPFVVDNTNPTVAERARYIALAREVGYRVAGYYFDCPIEECLKRNQQRIGKARVPPVALYATRKKLKPPAQEEGFDQVYRVRVLPDNQHVVEALPGPP